MNRLNKKADGQLGMISDNLTSYEKEVIAAYERGEVDVDTQGIHSDAARTIQWYKNEKNQAADFQKKKADREKNQLDAEMLRPGQMVGYGALNEPYLVVRKSKNSIRLKGKTEVSLQLLKHSQSFESGIIAPKSNPNFLNRQKPTQSRQ